MEGKGSSPPGVQGGCLLWGTCVCGLEAPGRAVHMCIHPTWRAPCRAIRPACSLPDQWARWLPSTPPPNTCLCETGFCEVLCLPGSLLCS